MVNQGLTTSDLLLSRVGCRALIGCLALTALLLSYSPLKAPVGSGSVRASWRL